MKSKFVLVLIIQFSTQLPCVYLENSLKLLQAYACCLPACTSQSHPSEHVKKSVRISELHKPTESYRIGWSARCVCETISTYQIRELCIYSKSLAWLRHTTTSCEGPWRSHQYRRTTISTTQCTLSFSFIFISKCFAIAWDSLVLPPAQRRVIQFISYAFLIVCRLLTARRVSFIERGLGVSEADALSASGFVGTFFLSHFWFFFSIMWIVWLRERVRWLAYNTEHRQRDRQAVNVIIKWNQIASRFSRAVLASLANTSIELINNLDFFFAIEPKRSMKLVEANFHMKSNFFSPSRFSLFFRQ